MGHITDGSFSVHEPDKSFNTVESKFKTYGRGMPLHTPYISRQEKRVYIPLEERTIEIANLSDISIAEKKSSDKIKGLREDLDLEKENFLLTYENDKKLMNERLEEIEKNVKDTRGTLYIFILLTLINIIYSLGKFRYLTESIITSQELQKVNFDLIQEIMEFIKNIQ